MCCHCAIGKIWPFSIVVCEIAVIRFMFKTKTVLPVLKADFPSASRLSFFGFRTSLKAHSRRTCMGPEKIGSDCSCERHHGKETGWTWRYALGDIHGPWRYSTQPISWFLLDWWLLDFFFSIVVRNPAFHIFKIRYSRYALWKRHTTTTSCALVCFSESSSTRHGLWTDIAWWHVGCGRLVFAQPSPLTAGDSGPPKGSIMADRGFVSARYEDA